MRNNIVRVLFMFMLIASVSFSSVAAEICDVCDYKELLVTAAPGAAQGGNFNFEVVGDGYCTDSDGTYSTEHTFYCDHGTVVNISNAQYIVGQYFFKTNGGGYTVDGDESPDIKKEYATVTMDCYDEPPHVTVTLNYLYDDECPEVEVINPAANDPILWYYGGIHIKGVATEYWPGSGIQNVTTQISEQFGRWFAPNESEATLPYRYEMLYNPTSGFYERHWPSPEYTLCAYSNVRIWAVDYNGNECSDTNKFGIDNAPPVTTKDWGEPSITCESLGNPDCKLYVTPATEFNLSAMEINEYGEPCGIGIDTINYQINGGPIHSFECEGVGLSECGIFHTEQFTLPAGCYQNLTYWAVDKIGNIEKHHVQIDNVDDRPPITEKTFVGPTVDRVTGDNYYVNVGTTVVLTAMDQSPEDDACPVGVDYLWYEIWWDSDGDGVVDTLLASGTPESGVVRYTFDRESIHEIRWYAVDLLGNVEELHIQEHAVDNTAPIIRKTVYGPQFGMCPPEPFSEEWCQIDGVTYIEVEAIDPDPHPVDRVMCSWGYDIIDLQEHYLIEEEIPAPFTVRFPEESIHGLWIVCWDALGNEVEDYEIFIVDKTPPTTYKYYEGPQYPIEGYPKWITTRTMVVLDPTDDIGPHDSGVMATYWRNTMVPDEYCWDQELCQRVSGDPEPWTLYEGPFFKDEESCHLIEYYSVDGVEKIEEVKKQCVFIDDTAPEVWKELEGPKVPADVEQWPPTEPGLIDVVDPAWYINQDTVISLFCEDQDPHPVDHETIYYMYFVDGRPMTDGWYVYRGPFSYEEDTYHELYYYCVDALGNAGPVHYELDIVDTQPPVFWKEVGEPKIPLYLLKGGEEINGIHEDYFITQQTPISIYCYDDEPHPVDDVTIQYRYRWMEDWEGIWGPWSPWVEVYDNSVTFTFDEDSIHELEYRCKDSLGNEWETMVEMDVVDTQAPETEKFLDGPVVGCSQEDILMYGYEDCAYVTQDTWVSLMCEDLRPHPVDDVTLHWKVDWKLNWEDEWQEGQWMEDGSEVGFYYERDSFHRLSWFCVDALGNMETMHVELDMVDTEEPIIEKEVIGPQIGTCPPRPGTQDECIIDGVTEIHVNAWDPGPHPVNNIYCSWDYDVEGGEKLGDGEYEIPVPFVINFPEESYHFLWIECWDELGNWVDDYEMFIVDKTPPVTEKLYGRPAYPQEEGIYPKWITSNTPIYLNAEDPEPHPSGVAVTYWRNSLVDDAFCWDQELCHFEAQGYGEWNIYEGPFYKGEDSCHLIEYYSVDFVNKREEIKRQCVFVDNQPPEVEKAVGTPKVLSTEITEWIVPEPYDIKDDAWYVTQDTEIYLRCLDPEPHPVDDVTIYYKYYNDGEMVTCGWQEYFEPFTYNEDTYHELYYYCVDALGNEGPVHYELDMVDTRPPETEKMVTGEDVIYIGEWPDYLIGDDAQVELYCEDFGPHPVNDVTIYWRTRWSYEGEGWTPWSDSMVYREPITFDESSYHEIEYWCVDALGNEEKHQFEIDAVDLDPPRTEKEVGEPKYFKEDQYHYWITQNTPIYLECEDVYPHPSGMDEIYWRYDLDGEGFTEWRVYEGPIYFDEDSIHTLQYYCVDQFGNEEEIQTEIDNVDTAPPEIEKYVRVNGGEPIYEGEIYIGGEDTVKFCADVWDVKQTHNEHDPGVGILEVWGRTSELDDPQMMWDEEEEAYCFEEEAQYQECGRWHYEVMARDYLGNEAEWTNGIEILIDNAPPIGEVLNPHAGQYYRDGRSFHLYMPVIDFGGNSCESDCIIDQLGCFFDSHDCPASGVDYCTFYAVDYNFEGIDQSNVKDIWDYLEELWIMGITPNVVEIGTLEAEVEGNEVICKGTLTIPEDSGLTETVFLWTDIVDKVGNKYSWLALNPWLSPITMNMDNEGPAVFIEDMGTLPGPLTSGDVIMVQAEVEEFQSGFDECWADIYTAGEGPDEDTGLRIDGNAIGFDMCEINGILPEGLESGNYYLMVHARDEQFNTGTDSALMIVDNDRPEMYVESPEVDGVYGEELPVELYIDDNSDIADETVKFRVMEIPAIGNLYCLFELCEDTGWVIVEDDEGGWYYTEMNLTEYGITGEGRYVFDAVACDELYVEEPDTELGFSMGNSRTDMHCRMISEHGADMYEED